MTTVKLYRKGGKKDFRIDKRNGMFFVFEGAKCLREYLTTVEEAEHQINLIVLNRKKMNMETVPILKADGTTYVKPIKFSAKNPKEKTCSICSKYFVDETFALRRKFCSDECKKQGHAITNKAANQKYQKRLKEKKDFEKRMNDLFALKQGILLTKNKKEKIEFCRYESAQLDYFFYTLQLWKETRIQREGGVTRRSFVKKGSSFNLSKKEFADYVWKCGLVYSDEPIPTEEQISEQPQDIFYTTPEEKVKENKDSGDFEAEKIVDDPFNREEPIIRDYMIEDLTPKLSEKELRNEVEMFVDIVIDALTNLFMNNNASFKAEMPQYVMKIASLLPISYSTVIEMGHRCQKGIAQTLEVKRVLVGTMLAKEIVPTDLHFEDAKKLFKSVSGISPLGTTDALAIYTNDVLKAFAKLSENQVDIAQRMTDLANSNSDKINRLIKVVVESEEVVKKSIEQSSQLITLVNESFDREKQLYEIIENMRGTISELQQKVSELPKKKKGWF